MARQSGSTLRTVRFYEEAGILTPSRRTDGGHRLFDETELGKLRLVSDLRAAGLSLDDIRCVLDTKRMAPTGALASAAVLGKLEDQIDRMQERVHLLQRLIKQLSEARSVLERCRKCTNQQNFPDDCGECKTLEDVDPVPPAVSVLWNVNR
ncbi:MAG: MerR family transcriptional regulator [Polyangiaceae bacterium]